MAEKKAKEKKPIYKKWWFWGIIIVVIGAIGGGSQSSRKVDDGERAKEESSKIAEKKNEYHVGDTIESGSYRIIVNSVQFGYDAENSYSKPSNGHEFVKVNITQENISSSSVSFNALDWNIEDEDGASQNYLSSGLSQASDFFGSGDLASGGKKTGSIVFEIPNGQRKVKLLFDKTWTEKISILLY